jgi:chromosome segregation ATPase
MRVYAPLEDPVVSELDQVAKDRGISRAQLIINAIESYLHQPEPSTEELDQMRIKLDQAHSEMDQQKIEMDQLKLKLDQSNALVDQLKLQLDQEKERLDQSSTAAADLKKELDQLQKKYDDTRSEANLRWDELKGLRSEVSQLKRELEENRSTNLKLRDELGRRQSEADQARSETEILKVKIGSYLDTMKLKDDEVAFLRAHIHQLSDKFPRALPPSEEEIKAKHWWQFWRRG